MNFRETIFNNDLDASLYYHNIKCFSIRRRVSNTRPTTFLVSGRKGHVSVHPFETLALYKSFTYLFTYLQVERNEKALRRIQKKMMRARRWSQSNNRYFLLRNHSCSHSHPYLWHLSTPYSHERNLEVSSTLLLRENALLLQSSSFSLQASVDVPRVVDGRCIRATSDYIRTASGHHSSGVDKSVLLRTLFLCTERHRCLRCYGRRRQQQQHAL